MDETTKAAKESAVMRVLFARKRGKIAVSLFSSEPHKSHPLRTAPLSSLRDLLETEFASLVDYLMEDDGLSRVDVRVDLFFVPQDAPDADELTPNIPRP